MQGWWKFRKRPARRLQVEAAGSGDVPSGLHCSKREMEGIAVGDGIAALNV